MTYSIKSRIWIETDGKTLLGEGRVALLRAIEETGSLSKAARSLNMSYKKAWNLIDTVNKRADMPVIETNIGGKDGGGATLTDYGRKLISIFDEINANCWEFLDTEINQVSL